MSGRSKHERRTTTRTAAQVRNLLKKKCERAGSLRNLAVELGVSHALISQILSGKREPAGRVLAALGIEKVVTYRRKGKSYE